MEKCTVRDPLLRLNKGWQIGATEEQLKVNGRIHLVKKTDKKGIFEVMVPFDLKEGEEIILNTALLPKELRLKMTGAAVEVEESEQPEDSEDEQPEDEQPEDEQLEDDLNEPPEVGKKQDKKKNGKKKNGKKKKDPFTE